MAYAAISSKVSVLIGKLKSNGSYRTRTASQIEGIAIHHTATSQNATPQAINKIHLDRGWPGIGYHYLIYPGGKIFQVNNNLSISNHVQNNNTKLIGIAFIGNYTQDQPTQKMYASGKDLIRKLRRKYPGIRYVKKHGDFKQTQCPGNININNLT